MYAFLIFLCFTISSQTNNYQSPLFQSAAFKSWPIICSLMQTIITPAGGQNATKMNVSCYGPVSRYFFYFFSERNHLLSVITNEEREPAAACGSLDKENCAQCRFPGRTAYVAQPFQVENLSTLGRCYVVLIEYKRRYLNRSQN